MNTSSVAASIPTPRGVDEPPTEETLGRLRRNAARERIDTKRVLELTGIRSPNTLRRYWKSGKFPTPSRVTLGTSGKLVWFQDEVLLWLAGRREVLVAESPTSESSQSA